MPAIPARDISDGARGLAEDLAADMPRIVLRPHRDALKIIRDLIRLGDFNSAQDVVRTIDFGAARDAALKRIRRTTRSQMLVGSGAVDKPSTSLVATGAPVPWEVDVGATRLIHNMTTTQLNTHTRRAFLDRITAASKFQKAAGDPIDPDKLASDINRYLRGEIKRVVDVSANLVGTRVAAYGMFYEARARGIAQYRIDAIIDDRTTEICKNMDGKIFDVERAFERTGQVLSTEDPATVAKLAPFPPQKEAEIMDLMKLDNAQLQAMGFDTPPFHFLCRSVVTLIDTQVDYDPVHWSNFPELRDTPVEIRDKVPKYQRAAADVWGIENPNELFTAALKSGPDDMDLYAPSAYSGNAHYGLNKAMRENSPLPETFAPIAAKLDELMETTSAPDVTYVYRGLGPNEAARMELGKVFQDDAFMSTSLSHEVAVDFAKSGVKNMLQIQIGTGKRVLPIFAASTVPAEYEMLLPRGAQLRIIGVSEQVIDGQKVNVIRAVYQGGGEVLPLSKIGDTELPAAVSVVKAEDRFERFTSYLNDMREASFSEG